MMTIRYGQQDITQEDIDAVVSVLKSTSLTQGPSIPLFEEAVRTHCRANYAIAVSNATAALHISCLALGLGPGDILWTSPNTFVASANCGLYCGANVDFVDIDPRTGNICPNALESKLLAAERTGKLPKIVIPVHFAGQPCDMKAIKALSDRYDFKIIEDASHAIGASYLGEPIGNGKFSDITVFSFHPVKIITTAEGGMALTQNSELAERLNLLRSHGITRDPNLMVRPMSGPWDYQQICLGFNYRMTDLQAALGTSQMDRLGQYIKKRHDIASRYDELLSDLPIKLPWQHPNTHSAYHLYVIKIPIENSRHNHKNIFEAMRAKDIVVNLHYIPVHTQPWYLNMGFNTGDFPEAERHACEAISIPMHPSLTEADQDYVVAVLRKALLS